MFLVKEAGQVYTPGRLRGTTMGLENLTMRRPGKDLGLAAHVSYQVVGAEIFLIFHRGKKQ